MRFGAASFARLVCALRQNNSPLTKRDRTGRLIPSSVRPAADSHFDSRELQNANLASGLNHQVYSSLTGTVKKRRLRIAALDSVPYSGLTESSGSPKLELYLRRAFRAATPLASDLGETMFENLTEKLQRTFKNLRGQGKLTEEHLDAALVEIREALLEGDVNVGVADELLKNIREKSIGSEVMMQLSPDQQVVKTVRDELTAMLGKHAKPLFASKPPSVWMIVGLQGSGKTTTTGKLAKWLTQNGHRPLVVSTDVYRPAAREQLNQVAKAVGTAIWPGTGTDKPLEIIRGAIKEAKLSASDVIVVDTAGRLHIDDSLMERVQHPEKGTATPAKFSSSPTP